MKKNDNGKNWLVRFYKDNKSVDVFTLQRMSHADASKFADKYLSGNSMADSWRMEELK